MIVRKVELVNFLSHRNTSLELSTGIVAIVGPNGAGKSSIVDAIAFTLFGFHSRSGRSNKQLIRLGAAYAATRVWFEVGGRLYMAERRIYRAERSQAMLYEVLEGGRLRPIARDVRSVEAEIERLLGIRKEVAKVALIAQQGELAEILENSRRRELVNKLLGLEAIEKTYEKLGSLIKVYEHKLGYIEKQLEIYKRQADRLAEAVKRADEAAKKLPLLDREEKRLQDEISELRRRRDELYAKLAEAKALTSTLTQIDEQLKRLTDEYAVVSESLDSIREKIGEVKKQLEANPILPIVERAYERGLSVEETLERIEEIRELADRLNERLRYYNKLKAEVEKLEEEKRRAERYEELRRKLEELENYAMEYKEVKSKAEVLQRNIAHLEAELEELRAKLQSYMIEVRRYAAGLLRGLESPSLTSDDILRRLRNLAAEYDERIQKLRETLNALKAEELSLEKKLEEIRDNIEKLASARGRCPLCGRPLSDYERRRLIHQLRAEKEAVEERLERVKNDEAKLEEQLHVLEEKRRRIENVLRRVSEMHGMLVELQRRIGEGERRLNELRNELRSLNMRALQLRQYLEEREKLRAELESLPSPQQIEKLIEDRVAELEKLEEELLEEYNRLNSMLEELGINGEEAEALKHEAIRDFRTAIVALQQLEERRRELEARLDAINQQIEALRVKRQEIIEKLEGVDKLEDELKKVEAEIKKREEQLREVLREKSLLEAAVEEGEKARKELETIKARIEELEKEKKGLSKLIGDLRRARKALGKDGLQKLIRVLAKSIIEKHMHEILTHFNIEFMDVRLTEDYDIILVTPDGHEKNFRMLSGGEKTAIALAFRIAFARMLTGRGRINTLILDEPTMFLDEHRKRELINILRYGWRSTSGILPQLILVTHDRELEEAADVIIEVEKVNGVSRVKRVTSGSVVSDAA